MLQKCPLICFSTPFFSVKSPTHSISRLSLHFSVTSASPATSQKSHKWILTSFICPSHSCQFSPTALLIPSSSQSQVILIWSAPWNFTPAPPVPLYPVLPSSNKSTCLQDQTTSELFHTPHNMCF